MSADSLSLECVVLVKADYSERFHLDQIHTKQHFIESLEQLLCARGQKYLWYVVPDKRLERFTTTKKDAQKGNFKRPGDIYLVKRDMP